MLRELEEGIINLIFEKSDTQTGPYMGELEDIESFEKCISVVPQILVGFDSEKYDNRIEKTATFKVYFITKTSNKDAKYRQKSKYELFDLIERCDKAILDYVPPLGYGCELAELKSEFEGISDYGYLAIFSRAIKVGMQEIHANLCDELTAEEMQFLEKGKR